MHPPCRFPRETLSAKACVGAEHWHCRWYDGGAYRCRPQQAQAELHSHVQQVQGWGGGLINKKQNNKRLYNTYIWSVLFIICSLFVNILFYVPYCSVQHQRNGRRSPIDSKNGGISHNCLGDIDGKHVNIKTPVNSGSQFLNYKHSFSVVMMALVDADYKFIYCDVGCNGRISDGGVFGGCSLDEAM